MEPQEWVNSAVVTVLLGVLQHEEEYEEAGALTEHAGQPDQRDAADGGAGTAPLEGLHLIDYFLQLAFPVFGADFTCVF